MVHYLVGGAVRDKLIGRPLHDRDYVVVGSTIEEMLSLGYKQVGSEFPVFLKEGCEYALARTEKKIGDKHTDFICSFDSDVTLKEDLLRRDFTMNALAMDEQGNIIDYFNGVKDIENKIIRHISDAFIEDPLRLLRACRFACQLNFEIAEETKQLCKQMVKDGMLDHLTKERIWKEMEKALQTTNFDKFILLLDEFGYLEKLLPDIYNLKNVPERLEYHPEGNTFAHLILTFQKVNNIEKEYLPFINFALLCHDLGKNLTKDHYPSHPNHEILGISLVSKLCDDLKVPNDYRKFAKIATRHHMKFYTLKNTAIKKQYDFVKEITKFKNWNAMYMLLKVHEFDLYGRKGNISKRRIDDYLYVKDKLQKIYNVMEGITFKQLPKETQKNLSKFQGEQLGKLYRDAMISYLKQSLIKYDT